MVLPEFLEKFAIYLFLGVTVNQPTNQIVQLVANIQQECLGLRRIAFRCLDPQVGLSLATLLTMEHKYTYWIETMIQQRTPRL